MSDNRKKEVIKNLEATIVSEQSKSGGGNTKVIADLQKKLKMILDGKNKGIRSRATK
jgi:hypothetical protein|tara:strand:- start:17 stop:187 length:171 start_codon:yes stop_codon:yes gene_type:complete